MSSGLLDSARGGVHLPGNALGFNSRVVGEKTFSTASETSVQPGGGTFFAAAQADTCLVRGQAEVIDGLRTRC